jgi:hypothetical protein
MPTTPPGLTLALRLAGAGIPDGLAAVLAEVCAVPPEKRTGEAAACVLDREGALKVVEWLEGQLGQDAQSRDAVVAMLGAGAVLFGAEESARLVLRHVPAAAAALEEMAGESEDAAGEDPLMSVEAKAEPLMLRAALERAAASDPQYNRELYMDESVLLPGFMLVPQADGETLELNGALVSTPGGFVFVLSDGMLSPGTASLLPPGRLKQGTLEFRLDQISDAVFLVPAALEEFDVAGTELGTSPDGELYAHFEVPPDGVVSMCLVYTHWPVSRQEVLLRRFETVVGRVATALQED